MSQLPPCPGEAHLDEPERCSGAAEQEMRRGRMPAFSMRGLGAAEVALGRTIYADEIAWGRVRIGQMPKLGFAAVVPFGSEILYSAAPARWDFAAAPLGEQGLFIHELAHVWQARRGCVLAFAKLSALGRGAYRYAPRAEARLADYNIEQQAEIARHLFLARAGARTPAPREWLEDVWAGR